MTYRNIRITAIFVIAVSLLLQGCLSQPCSVPVNCQLSDWSGWGACVNGARVRTRQVLIKETNGGTCPNKLEERATCP
jgi:hypothetical protein